MSMFTLAMSCLTTSNLPWFIDLTIYLDSWTLDFKEIKPVNSKGNQSWIFIGRADGSSTLTTDVKNWLLRKDSDAGKGWRQQVKGMTEGKMVGWLHRLNEHEFEQAVRLGNGWKAGMLASMGSQSQTWLSDWTEPTDGPNIPASYAILILRASDFTFTTRHIHSCVLFLLWISLFTPSGTVSLLFSSSSWTPTNLGSYIFQCRIFLPLHTVHGVLKATVLKWLAIPSPVDHVLSELSTMTHPSWVARHHMAHRVIELGKVVVHAVSLVSFLWLWFSFFLPSDGWG